MVMTTNHSLWLQRCLHLLSGVASDPDLPVQVRSTPSPPLLWGRWCPVLNDESYSLIQQSPPLTRDTFPDPQQTPATADSTNPVILFFSYTYTPIIKFNLQIRRSKRLIITNNKRTIITIYYNKNYVNVVSLEKSY